MEPQSRVSNRSTLLQSKENPQNQKGKKTKAEVGKPNELPVAKKHKSMDSDDDDEEPQSETGTSFYSQPFVPVLHLNQGPAASSQGPVASDNSGDENCEGCGDVVGVLTLLVGGVAQAFHDDRVVELRVQLGVEEVDGEGQERTGRSGKGEASQRGAPMDMTVDDKVFAQDLSQMRCEMTSPGVKECALRARSTHGVHHAIVEVNIVIGVVLGEVHVDVLVHVIPLCDDAVVVLTLGLIAHVVIVVRRSHFSYNFAVLEVCCLHPPSVTVNCVGCYRILNCNSAPN